MEKICRSLPAQLHFCRSSHHISLYWELQIDNCNFMLKTPNGYLLTHDPHTECQHLCRPSSEIPDIWSHKSLRKRFSAFLAVTDAKLALILIAFFSSDQNERLIS